jgi:cytochrome c
MRPDDPNGDSLDTPPKATGPTFAGYVVILVGCLFAIFYTYKASREDAPAPMEQGQSTSQASDQAATTPSPKPGPAVAETAPSVAQPKADAIPAQAVASPTPQSPQGPTPQPSQGAAPPPAAAAQAPAAVASPNAPAPSQGTKPDTATQTAPSNGDLELAFNGHCRECHAFDKGDNRLGPSLYGVVGRKAGTAPNFAYSESLKGSGVTWDEPTLDKWITNPNALIPGNNMGAIFGGVADPAERAMIIAFLKQDIHASPPASNSTGQPPPPPAKQ